MTNGRSSPNLSADVVQRRFREIRGKCPVSRRPRPLEERFWDKVDRRGPDACWPWIGGGTIGGYGSIRIWRDGRWTNTQAHRVAYELTHGPTPKEHDIDHICRNVRCVNPLHLQAVTHRENIHRASHATIVREGRCARGHEGDLYVASNGSRRCRACSRMTLRRWTMRRRYAALRLADPTAYGRLREHQQGKCACCAERVAGLEFDPESPTEYPRLVCAKCLRGLDAFAHNRSLVLMAARYLAGVSSSSDTAV